VRPSVAGRRASTPPFAPQTRQDVAPPPIPAQAEPRRDDVVDDALDAPVDIANIAPPSMHETEVAESTEPIELTDWLEDDDVVATSRTTHDDASAVEMEAEQTGAVEPATEWPKETWHGDPWSDPAAEHVAAASTEQPIDSAAPVTPFEFAAEFPEPEAFATSSPPLAAPDETPDVAPYAETIPAGESPEDVPTSRPAWVAPTVEPIAESAELLARYATRPESGAGESLDRLKEIEPWAMPATAPSAASAEDAIAAALERIARRVRDGEVALPPETASTTDEAALALTLAALLRTPPKG
jgi:hypothetical protein